ncbi:hypothetical protein HDU81_000622 [Chytriomyces hyalinus]|nr:hypothetical protein HDU81_000622 [Chytriomyces hyalinus]
MDKSYFHSIKQQRSRWYDSRQHQAFAQLNGIGAVMQSLAAYLSKGIGCEQNAVEALRWAQAAIDQGYVDAHSTVGTIYMDGFGVPVNLAKAIEHYHLGMDAGSIECISYVGMLFETGTGVEKDVQKAVEFYEKAIGLGCGLGYYYLGTLYEDGMTAFHKAAPYYEQAIQLKYESPAAKRRLGYLYDKGIGVEQSNELALHYFLEAAKYEDSWALYYLGATYAEGAGVVQDNTKAFEFYERAANQKNPAAMSNLGHLLSNGQRCTKNLVRSAELYQQSAALGDEVGAYNCGVIFQHGEGVEGNLFKAVDYFRMAVRLKCDGANERLGPTGSISRYIYYSAEILKTEKMDKEALDHYYAAAVQGYPLAITSVAEMFRNAAGLGRVLFEKKMRYFEPRLHTFICAK